MTQSIDQYIASWLFIGFIIILILYLQRPLEGFSMEYGTWAILEVWKAVMIIVALLLALKCAIDHTASAAGTRDMEMAK